MSSSKGKGSFYANGDGKGNATRSEPDIRDFMKALQNNVESLQSNLQKFPQYTTAFLTERNYQEELRIAEEEKDRLEAKLKTSQRATLDLGAACEAYKKEIEEEYRKKLQGVEKLEKDIGKATTELDKLRADKRALPTRLQERFEDGKNHQKSIDSLQAKALMDENANLRGDISALKEKINEGIKALKEEKDGHKKTKRDNGFIKAGLEKEKEELGKKLAMLTSFREDLGENDKFELESLQERVKELSLFYFPESPPKVPHMLPSGSPFEKIYQSGSVAEGSLCRAAVRDIINKALRENVLQHPVHLLAKSPPAGLEVAVQALDPEKESAFRLLTIQVLEELEKQAKDTPGVELGSHLSRAAADVVEHVRSHMEEPRSSESLENDLKDEFLYTEKMWMGMQKTRFGVIPTIEGAEPTTTEPDFDKTVEFCLSPAFVIPTPSDDNNGHPVVTPPTPRMFVTGEVLHRGSQAFQLNVEEKREFDNLREQLAQKNHIASPSLDGGEFSDVGRGDISPGGGRGLRRSAGRVGRPPSIVDRQTRSVVGVIGSVSPTVPMI
ncbi:MAG: hypothetical protein M1839_002287 [Geoglossum umbratile]|nr:MAG: hypothetical protein M1839_002287 [Geoglossum umbratile]